MLASEIKVFLKNSKEFHYGRIANERMSFFCNDEFLIQLRDGYKTIRVYSYYFSVWMKASLDDVYITEYGKLFATRWVKDGIS